MKDFRDRMKCFKLGQVVSNWKKSTSSVENEFSNSVPVKSGIPQGSVLGPTLFVIFVNDMPEIVECMCQLFADDAKIF